MHSFGNEHKQMKIFSFIQLVTYLKYSLLLGEVLGLVGQNGIGKSTALKILASKQKPNLGRFSDSPDWTEILTYFRGSELQNYFTKILEDHLKALIKPQYVDQIPKAVKGPVGPMLDRKDDLNNSAEICEM